MTAGNTSFLEAYKIGDSDYTRPWGGYTVTDVKMDDSNGDEVVEKDIQVNGCVMLSVQSHVGRSEIWQAKKGTLTALIDGQIHTVAQGQTISIPKGAIHAMINTGSEPIIVHEIQRGVCREEDNTRYYDMSGRAVVQSDDPRVLASIDAARQIAVRLNAQNPTPASGVK